MKVNLNEIKSALAEIDGTPWRVGTASPNGLQNVGTKMGVMVCQTFNKEDANLIANAPEWLASLVEHYEECAADAIELHKQVEEMQKTQSQILKRVADISPSLAQSIIKEFALKGEQT